MIHIDGAHGEGGGQILRTALSLAAITGQAVHIDRIRLGRPRPGLAPQHLAGVRAVAELCDAEVSGAALGATTLEFSPRRAPAAGDYVFDVAHARKGGSAGSVGLLLQAVLPPLALTPGHSRVILRGGTHVPWSPSFEYIQRIYLPALRPMGVAAAVHLVRHGFYPRGGGELLVEIEGRNGPLRALQRMERGSLETVRGLAAACDLPAHIARRMAQRAHGLLRRAGMTAEVVPQHRCGGGPGAYLFLEARYEGGRGGFTALGARGRPAEQVAEEACRDLLGFHASGAPVDLHLGDQLLLPVALAVGTSRYRVQAVTAHLRTNAYVVQRFLPVAIHVQGGADTPGTVTCRPPNDHGR